jgi:hypothetical protein
MAQAAVAPSITAMATATVPNTRLPQGLSDSPRGLGWRPSMHVEDRRCAGGQMKVDTAV